MLTSQYKKKLSGFGNWRHRHHAEEYLLFPGNVGPYLSIDETCLSAGEVYTLVTNKEGHGGRGTLVASIKGTKSQTVTGILEKIPRRLRQLVQEVTLDLSPSMMLIAETVFPNARITNDRFHIHRLFYEAVDDLRVTYRWILRDIENDEIRRCKQEGQRYVPFRFPNGDTRRQLLARSKFILTRHKSKWTDDQRWRADILFECYPELKEAYDLAMELNDIYNKKVGKSVARRCLIEWFEKVRRLPGDAFRTVIETFTNHFDTILNFFADRQTNASAESFNAKVKAFRAQFRGVSDIDFFLFRLMKLCA